MDMASGERMLLASAVLVISGIRLFSRRWESSVPADFLNPRVQDFGLSSLLCGHVENQVQQGPADAGVGVAPCF